MTDATTSISDRVIKTIDDMLHKMAPRVHGSIYRVPDSLRRVNPECYTPRLVAIGPLHRDNPHLRPMEEAKLRTFNNFFSDRVNDAIKLNTISQFIVREEQAIRRSYREEIHLDIMDFSRMIVLDSVFMVGLLLRKEDSDAMLKYRWFFNDLVHDILLFENQIPRFVTYYVYTKLKPSEDDQFSVLVHSFFKDVMKEYDPPNEPNIPSHFIGQLWIFLIPIFPSWREIETSLPRQPTKKNWKPDALTASRLLEYGVIFEPTTTSIRDITFSPIDGILRIPIVKVNELTETLFSNLLVHDLCERIPPRFVSDYIIFMDSIIDTQEDVKILVRAGIIHDDLQDPENVIELFKNLYKVAITKDIYFCFAQLFRELKDYRRDWQHKWKSRWYKWKLKEWYKWKLILERGYFNSPWSIFSFIAAVILLGLTLVQTVCSIYQAKGIKM